MAHMGRLQQIGSDFEVGAVLREGNYHCLGNFRSKLKASMIIPYQVTGSSCDVFEAGPWESWKSVGPRSWSCARFRSVHPSKSEPCL